MEGCAHRSVHGILGGLGFKGGYLGKGIHILLHILLYCFNFSQQRYLFYNFQKNTQNRCLIQIELESTLHISGITGEMVKSLTGHKT